MISEKMAAEWVVGAEALDHKNKWISFGQCLSICGVLFFISGCSKLATNYPEEITMGIEEGMIIQKHDVSLQSHFMDEQFLEIDLDENGEVDLVIRSIWLLVMGGGVDASSIKLELLNEKLELIGQSLIDTTFSRTEISVDSFYEGDNIKKTYRNYSSCFSTSGEDSVSWTREFFLLNTYEPGEVFSNQNYAETGDRAIFERRKYTYTGFTSQSGEIEYSQTIDYYNNECHLFPINQEFYIGFKIKESNSQRLGWIKVNYAGSNEITIIESAISL